MATWCPALAPRGVQVFNSYVRVLLVEGARYSGKSIAISHKLMRHAIENDGAVIGLVTRSKVSGKIGPWADLIKPGGIVDQWAKVGISYSVEPKYDADSKMAYFRIRTPGTPDKPEGGEAEFQLHSLFDEKKVEEQFKGSRFTLLYLVEADRIRFRTTFSSLLIQLRSMTVPSERFQMIIDTNPPDIGPDHWLYEAFFEEKNKGYATIHFAIDDNPFITKEQKQEIYDNYKHDQNLLDRYYYGKWVKASANGVFAANFNPNIHIVGKLDKGADVTNYRMRDHWEILRPDEDATTIEEGWDIGDVNLGYSMGVPRFHAIQKVICYDIIDELAYTNTMASIGDVVDEVLDRRDYWESWMTTQYGVERVRWLSWCDSSSNRHRIAAGGTEAAEVSRLSNRRIHLSGVRKGSGSVSVRRDLLNRLLFEGRIYISPLCVETLNMIRYIRAKPGIAIDPTSPHKHIFDSLTYMLGYGLAKENAKREKADREQKRLSSYTIPM